MNLRQLVTAFAVAGITLILLGLVLMATGCAAVAHTAGLATTDDVRAERDDQHAIDNKIVNEVADVIEGKVTPAEMVNDIANVGAQAVERTYRRTEPPPPPSSSPPTGEVVGGILLVANAIYTAFVHRSNKQTDAWVAEVETKKADKA